MILSCSPQITQQSIALVVAFMSEFFINKDVTAVNRYVGESYVQHNPMVGNGKASLVELFRQAPSIEYTPGGVVGNCDIVMVYGRYSGLGAQPSVGVDIFRVANGWIVEHWDVLQTEVPASQTASGNPMFTSL